MPDPTPTPPPSCKTPTLCPATKPREPRRHRKSDRGLPSSHRHPGRARTRRRKRPHRPRQPRPQNQRPPHALRHAADALWPYTDSDNAPTRKAFQLPAGLAVQWVGLDSAKSMRALSHRSAPPAFSLPRSQAALRLRLRAAEVQLRPQRQIRVRAERRERFSAPGRVSRPTLVRIRHGNTTPPRA